MSKFEDPDDPAKAQLDPDELFIEEDTVWSEPFMVNAPGNFIVKLGPPVTSLGAVADGQEDVPHILRVVCKLKSTGYRTLNLPLLMC